MNLNIKYYGMLSEVTQCNEETIAFSEDSVSELLNMLFQKYPLLKEKDFQVAQDQKIVANDAVVSSSEIALLPPFAGG